MFFHVVALPPNQFRAWLSSQQTPGPGGLDGLVVLVPLDHEGGRMTVLADRPVAHEHEHEHHEGPTGLLKWMTSTDHKLIGMNYMVTSLVMFFLAGLMALALRTQLATPNSSFLSFQQYNALFTMHGSLMLYLFAGPLRLRRPGQLHPAAADRRAGHGVPPAERPVVLAVPQWLDHDAPRLPRGRGGRRLRMGGLRAAVDGAVLAGVGTRPVDPRASP